MNTPKTRYELTKSKLEIFIAYLKAMRILKEDCSAIFKDKGLTYGPSTENFLLRWRKVDYKFEAVDDGALEGQITPTLQRLTSILEELKVQLDQTKLQKLIEEEGWKRCQMTNPI